MRLLKRAWARLRSAFQAIITTPVKKILTRIDNFTANPPLDVLSAGIFGHLVGRSIVNIVLIAAAVSASLWFGALLLLCLLLADMTIHGLTIKQLFHLMRLELLSTSSDLALAHGLVPVSLEVQAKAAKYKLP